MKRLIIGLGCLLVMVAAGAWLLLNTTAGLRLALNLAPGQFSAGDATGSIAGGFSLEDVRYDSGTAVVEMDEFYLDWRFRRLLARRIEVQEGRIDGLTVTLTGEEAPPRDEEPAAFSLPVGVTIDNFTVNDIVIAGEEGVIQRIDRAVLRTRTRDQTVLIEELAVYAPEFELNAGGEVELAQTPEFDLKSEWRYTYDPTLTVSGRTEITGSTALANVDTVLERPVEGNLEIQLEDLTGDLSWQATVTADGLDVDEYVEQLAAPALALKLRANGTLDTMHVTGSIESAGGAAPAGATDVYTLRDLDLTFTVDAPTMDLSDPEALAHLAWDEITFMPPGDEPAPITIREGEADVTYREGRFTVQTGSSFDYAGRISGAWNFQGEGDPGAFRLEEIMLRLEQGTLTGTAGIDRSGEQLEFDAALGWDEISYPVNPDMLVSLTRGNITAGGTIADYRLEIDTGVRLNGEPPFDLSLAATGNSESLDIGTLNLDMPGGGVSGAGTVNWAGAPELRFSLDGSKLDPGIYLENWPGQVDFRARVTAIGGEQGFTVDIENLQASGTLRDYPMQLGFAAVVRPGSVDIGQAELVSASSSVSVSGTWGSETSLNWAVRSPDLNALHHELSGSLNGEGRIAGNIEDPGLIGELQGRDIVSPWVDVEALAASFTINRYDRGAVEVRLDADGLVYGDYIVSGVDLSVSGDEASHHYRLSLDGKDLALQLSGEGSYADSTWTGRTAGLEIEQPAYGRWTLDNPVVMQVSRNAVDSGNLCLVQDGGTICASGAWNDSGAWNGRFSATGLPYGLFEDYLPEDVDADGTISLALAATQAAGVPLEAEGEIHSEGGEFTFRVNETAQTARLELLDGDFILDDGVLAANLMVNTAESSIEPLRASVRLYPITSLSPDIPQLNVEGRVGWVISDLAFISSLSPQLMDVRGEMNVDLRIDGTVANPDLAGTFLLDNGNLLLPQYGIELTGVSVSGSSSREGLYEFTGSASSGEGELTLNASVIGDLGDTRTVRAEIRGEDVEVMNTPEIRAIASPDITMEVTPERTIIKGTVTIPRADIDLGEIRSSTTVSDDVVMEGAEEDTAGAAGRQTNINLKVRLGDDISVRGQGITGDLTGELQVFSTPKDELLGNGEIRILNGKFSAYGQSLVIREGRLIYNNNPIDNPELRITAVREVGEVTAGINVTGLLSNPSGGLFSTPSMNDDEVLSYIVFGRPLSSLTSGEGTDLIGAATALGVRNSGFITKSLSSTFGLDELQLTSEPGGQNASLVIGKYLTPKLYISYVVGLLETFSTAKIRYEIDDNWALEAKSGTDVEVDLYYRFNK